jgi:stage V sporulation protein D (sporulation-specific penicillin-binding protein)
MRRAFKYRLRILSGGIVLAALLIVTRLYFVQIVHGEEFALRAERQYVSSSQELFNRGSIFFTNKDGTEISAATLATGFLIAIDTNRIENPEKAYSAIVEKVPTLDQEKFMASAAKESDPYEVVARQVSDDAGRAVSELKIPGVIVERERWRQYPAGRDAAQSVGIIAYDNDNTLAGRLGLERYYNDMLAQGGEGVFGNFFAELFANLTSAVSDPRKVQQGDVITTIEPVVQKELVDILSRVNSQYGSVETGGIIMNPRTGEIYALDTVPTFDPNNFQQEDAEYFGNPIVEKRYEFGSIFKTMTMTAGLDSGVITPETQYNDTGCIDVNKKTICNFDLKARGTIPMQQILSQSLNVGSAFITTKIGHDRFREYYTKLGLGTETGIDLPNEIHGDIHNLESPRDVEYITASFGQGIATTPIETIRALSSIANDGKIVTPHLTRAIRLQSGVTKKLSWGQPVQVFSPQATDEVTRMLVKVVDEKLGGGHVKIPSMSVAAKTGTAQMAGPDGKYYENLYFHSFFGYFPATDPEFVILLYTKQPQGVQYASETLTNPFMGLTHFLINYYDVPPDRADMLQARQP